MTREDKIKKARKWVKQMQKLLPCVSPVYISARASELAGEWEFGTCSRRKRGFEIRVDWNQSWDVLSHFVLPHEYTHARVWGRLQAGMDDHDAHFGVELMVVDREAEKVLCE